jgi:hypothetical protein
MPKILWAEALNYATWLKNRLPSQATPGKTPYELVNNSKPNLALAHEFGTPVYVHVTTGGKLEAKAEEAIFVGVDQESKGYQIWWAGKRKVSIERNVTFPPMGPVTVKLFDNEKFFLDYGFTRSQVDQAVYFRRNAEEHTVITVSVDDMAMTSKCLWDIECFKVELRERFNISDLGELTWLLGLKIE